VQKHDAAMPAPITAISVSASPRKAGRSGMAQVFDQMDSI